MRGGQAGGERASSGARVLVRRFRGGFFGNVNMAVNASGIRVTDVENPQEVYEQVKRFVIDAQRLPERLPES